jgi:glycosyltransferase involved in cell wall biosynthesis
MSSDVCLFLEGTYPYVSGGVASWVHQLIRDLSDTRFSLVFLGGSEDTHREFRYPIPDNVVELREVFLQGALGAPRRVPSSGLSPKDWEDLGRFLEGIRRQDPAPFADLVRGVFAPGRFSLERLVYSEDTWRFLLGQYGKLGSPPSFLDYFWTWRFTHLPLLRVLSTEVPLARCYHAVSTGYAGLMAAAASIRTGTPLILTEHGIYTRERGVEISQAEWIHDEEGEHLGLDEGVFKDWWVRMFVGMSRIAYHHADVIATLYEGNREVQIQEGADPGRIRVIPNGVDAVLYRGMRTATAPGEPPTVALIGRVVPIKDVRAFLQAARILHERGPAIRFWILGPTDEDPDYYQDCEILTGMLGLQGVVSFLGKVDVAEYYGRIDCLVLTSVSEGQPLAVLEAMACGIPVVSTDVGACRELIEGKTIEDRALGPAGMLTPIGQPDRTADAVLGILKDRGRYRAMASAGRLRVERHYRVSQVSANYLSLYERLPMLAQLRRG